MDAICVFDPNSSFNQIGIEGVIKFHQSDPGKSTLVEFNLSKLPPNTRRGCHIHEYGDLSKGCQSACSHYNPYGKKHGSISLYGDDRHVGDMISNIVSDKYGNVRLKYRDNLINLFGPFTVIGRSIVIHENEDDMGLYRNEKSERGKESSKTGNAGSRIACSIIGLSGDKC